MALAQTSARLLEFGSLLELLGGYASSAPGKQRVAELAPSSDAAWIAQLQQRTAEIRGYWRGGGRFEFSGLIDTTELVHKSRIEGATLDTLEIRDLVAAIDRAAEWREIALHPPSFVRVAPAASTAGETKTGQTPVSAQHSSWPAVEALARGIADFTDFLRFFRRK